MSNITLTLPSDTAPIAGPQLLGTLFNWGLYGVLSVQVYMYHIAFPRDSLVTKILVYSVYVLDTVQTILVTSDAFTYYAKGFGNVETLGLAQLEWLAVPMISGIVSCTVQMYYARRLYILSRSFVLCGVICLVALMQGSAAIAEGALFFIIKKFDDLTSKTFVSCSIWLAGSAACDIIIASSMTYLLLRRDTKIPETHALVTRLVHLIVETGSLTAITATIDLALFLAFPNRAYHAAVALTLAKLYSNSMLVILNSRMRIRGARGSVGSGTGIAMDGGENEETGIGFATHRSALETTQQSVINIHPTEEDEIQLEERNSFSSRKKARDLTAEP